LLKLHDILARNERLLGKTEKGTGR